MTDEELDEAITEGLRDRGLWTPPEVDSDLLVWRAWNAKSIKDPEFRKSIRAGRWDNSPSAQAYLAGARLAREQERERAKVLLRGLEDIVDADQDEISHMARAILAKYRGEA